MFDTKDEPTSPEVGGVRKGEKTRKSSGYIQKNHGDVEITPEMIDAGVSFFEQNCEGRFPVPWPCADLFVVGLFSAMLHAVPKPFRASCHAHKGGTKGPDSQ